MSLYFKSIRSSSSGNCLALCTEKSRVLIDCGFNSQISCKRSLRTHFGHNPQIDAVVVTHNHGDHISYSSLRTLGQYGIPLRIHENNINTLQEKHFRGYNLDHVKIKPFSDKSFDIGEFKFHPFKVPHQPDYPTYAFLIHCHHEHRWYKLIIASDFYDGREIIDHLVDVDFIYIESNHDPQLLALYPNYNSRFHMSNPKAGEILCNAREKSKRSPKIVMVGHLSCIRNNTDLALCSICKTFRQNGQKLDFKIFVAPRYEPSSTIRIV
jgi:phosphoribosyl 1,2-cyclic phosphodiesterase